MVRLTTAPQHLAQREDEHLTGSRLGKYRLEKLLGHGNRSSVYQGKDITTWQVVAVRVLDADLSADRAFVARFRQAVERAARVQHRYLLPILDWGEQEGMVYLARPLVGGDTLRDLLGQPLSPTRALRLFLPIAEALDYAHAHGLVHGDLKPGNILLPAPDEPLIADFGMAQAFPNGNSFIATARGAHTGTPEYISPEQGRGAPFDKYADLYALGVMLYEALTGRPPFRAEPGDTARAVVMAHVAAPPPSPRTFLPSFDARLERVLLRALAKQPQNRYPSAAALCAAFAEAAGLPYLADTAGTPTTVAPASGVADLAAAPYVSRRKANQRQRQLRKIATVAVLALIVLAVFLLTR